jgi:hypothetical protein
MTSRNRWILGLVAVALLLAVAISAGGIWAKNTKTTADVAKAQAEAGVRSLAAMDTTAAISDFTEANQGFDNVSRSLGPDWIAQAVEPIPWVGKQYVAARTLARVGSDGSLAGLEFAKAVGASPPATSTATAAGQSASALPYRLTHIRAALAALSDAARRADTLSADGLVPTLAKPVHSIQDALSKATPLAGRSRALLQLGSYLLSGNHRILVVSQDGAELRPTGGWAGSFGILNVGESGVNLESYQDVFTLPTPPGHVEPPPGARQSKEFNFRNANWWLDFPTSAQKMLEFWGAYKQAPVDGIVVVDTVVMAELLDVVGPITVPQSGETFTSQNLLARLLFLTQVQKGGQPDRKNVLVELATELEKRLMESSPGDLGKAARAIANAADEKHVQMYFTNPEAQNAADALGWSGRVAPPTGATDVVAISNAMNKPGKVNVAMKKSIAYDVALQPDRSAETTLSLGYANTGPYLQYLPPDFRDWLRVYRAPGTEFPTTNPDGSRTTTTTEFGFPAETREFTVTRGQSKTEVLTARVPDALKVDTPGSKGDRGRYQLYLVRQADLEEIPTVVTVSAPPGWRVLSAKAYLVASGAALPVNISPDRAVMTVPLSGDLTLDVRLSGTNGTKP